MNTTTAAAQAKVSVATIRAWCRMGAVAATKRAGRWVIEAASLARRIAIGQRRQPTVAVRPQDHTCGGWVAPESAKSRCVECRKEKLARARLVRATRTAPRRQPAPLSRSRRFTCECASGRHGGACTC